MPAKVIRGLGGLADLTALVSHVAADNPTATKLRGESILRRTRQLETFPVSGKHHAHTPRGEVRELVLPPCRILYRLDETQRGVRIHRIWHSARDRPEFSD